MSLLVNGALEAYQAGDSDVARECFRQMTREEQDEYLTAVRELDANRSD